MASLTDTKQVIDAMFRDASVPESETRENLHQIVEHCESLIEALDDELGDDEE